MAPASLTYFLAQSLNCGKHFGKHGPEREERPTNARLLGYSLLNDFYSVMTSSLFCQFMSTSYNTLQTLIEQSSRFTDRIMKCFPFMWKNTQIGKMTARMSEHKQILETLKLYRFFPHFLLISTKERYFLQREAYLKFCSKTLLLNSQINIS